MRANLVIPSVPATRPYSYAYIGGRAHLVDPVTGTVVADLTDEGRVMM